jgi:regulatory protein YycI of two-component signal transduction system YycFG
MALHAVTSLERKQGEMQANSVAQFEHLSAAVSATLSESAEQYEKLEASLSHDSAELRQALNELARKGAQITSAQTERFNAILAQYSKAQKEATSAALQEQQAQLDRALEGYTKRVLADFKQLMDEKIADLKESTTKQ